VISNGSASSSSEGEEHKSKRRKQQKEADSRRGWVADWAQTYAWAKRVYPKGAEQARVLCHPCSISKRKAVLMGCKKSQLVDHSKAKSHQSADAQFGGREYLAMDLPSDAPDALAPPRPANQAVLPELTGE
jgi:hypothetical protein